MEQMILTNEFLNLAYSGKLKTNDDSIINSVRGTVSRVAISKFVILLSLCIYTFKNFKYMRIYLGTFHSLVFTAMLSPVIVFPCDAASKLILLKKFDSVALEYRDQVYQLSANYRKFLNETHDPRSSAYADQSKQSEHWKQINEDSFIKNLKNDTHKPETSSGFYESHSQDRKSYQNDQEFYETHFSGNQSFMTQSDDSFDKTPNYTSYDGRNGGGTRLNANERSESRISRESEIR